MGYKTHIGKAKSHTGVTHNDEADIAARNVVEGHKTPDKIFTDADPPVGGLRTWPQTRKTSKDTPPNITILADLHSSLRKIIRTHTHITPQQATVLSTAEFYIKLEPQGRTTQYMHTQQQLSRPEETQWRWHEEYTSTYAKGNTAHRSYTPSGNPRLQTHTFLEAVDSPPSSELNATIAHSDFYSNSYRSLMEDASPSCVRTWGTHPSPTLVTLRPT